MAWSPQPPDTPATPGRTGPLDEGVIASCRSLPALEARRFPLHPRETPLAADLRIPRVAARLGDRGPADRRRGIAAHEMIGAEVPADAPGDSLKGGQPHGCSVANSAHSASWPARASGSVE